MVEKAICMAGYCTLVLYFHSSVAHPSSQPVSSFGWRQHGYRCYRKFDRSEISSRRSYFLGNSIAERYFFLGNNIATRKFDHSRKISSANT